MRVLTITLGSILLAGCGRPGEEPVAVEPRPSPHAAVAVDEQARAALPARAKEALARATLPVLAPPRAELLASSSLSVNPHWFALSAHGEGYSIALHGSSAARVVPHIRPVEGDTEVRAGAKGFVTQNEGIWSARWIEHGVAYSLDLECASPAHARCADANEVLALARALVHVGGGAQ